MQCQWYKLLGAGVPNVGMLNVMNAQNAERA